MKKSNSVNPAVMGVTIGILVISIIAFAGLLLMWVDKEDIKISLPGSGFNPKKDTIEVIIQHDDYGENIASIVEQLTGDKGFSDYETYKVLHDWVASYLDYNYDALTDDVLLTDCNDPEYCLNTGWAVCGGYAALYQDLCTEAGLDCYFIEGKADFLDFNGIGHAWNAVRLDGKYYHVDVCWDDTSSPTNDTVYDWFLQGNGYVTNSFREWYSGVNFQTASYNITRSTLSPYSFKTLRG